jgi:hypothetical protein
MGEYSPDFLEGSMDCGEIHVGPGSIQRDHGQTSEHRSNELGRPFEIRSSAATAAALLLHRRALWALKESADGERTSEGPADRAVGAECRGTDLSGAAELTRKRLRRGVHTSVRQLQADIRAFIDRHNQNPKPFKWTKSADQILASVKRFCQKTQKTLCGEL